MKTTEPVEIPTVCEAGGCEEPATLFALDPYPDGWAIYCCPAHVPKGWIVYQERGKR